MEKKEDIIQSPAVPGSIKLPDLGSKQENINKQANSVFVGRMKRSFDDNNVSDTDNVKRKKVLLEKQTCSTNIVSLPDELLMKIFLYLETSDIWNVSLTCTRMSNLTLDSCLWKNVCLKTNHDHQLLDKIFQLMGHQTDKLHLSAHFKRQHVVNLDMSLKLSVVCENLTVLHLNHQTLDASEIYITSFPQSLKELSLTDTNMLNTSYIRCFLNRIDSHLVNLETLIFTDCKWFVTHSIMILSRIPKLKCLKLDGCIQLQECMPYVSLSTRYGFKNLQEIDLRRTFMSDNEVSCFNVCRNLRNLYLSHDDRVRKHRKKVNKAHYACLAASKLYRTSHTVTCLKNLYNERVVVDNDLIRLNMHLSKLTDNQLLASREVLTQEHLSLQRAMAKVYISKTGHCDDTIDETDESSSSEDENEEKIQLKSKCLLHRKFQRFKQCMKNFKSLVNHFYQNNRVLDADIKYETDTDIKNEEKNKKPMHNSSNTWNHKDANDAAHLCFDLSDDDEDENEIPKMLHFSEKNIPKQEGKETRNLKSDDDSDNPKPGCSKEIITASPTPGCSKDIDDRDIEYEGQESSDDNVDNTNSSARRDASTYCGEPHRFISIVTHTDQYSYDLKRAIPTYLHDPQVHDLIVIERIRQPENDRCNGESSRQASNNTTSEKTTVANLTEHKNENDKATETRQVNSDNESNVEDGDQPAQNHVVYEVDREEGGAGACPFYIQRRLEPVERERVAPILPHFLEEIEVEINREQWPNVRTSVGLFTYLSNTITDRTIHSLFNPRAENRNLERLSLNGYSQITDASLLMIATSDQIRYLDVRNTGVTPQGCYIFRNQHPDCEFLCDFCEDDS